MEARIDLDNVREIFVDQGNEDVVITFKESYSSFVHVTLTPELLNHLDGLIGTLDM